MCLSYFEPRGRRRYACDWRFGILINNSSKIYSYLIIYLKQNFECYNDDLISFHLSVCPGLLKEISSSWNPGLGSSGRSSQPADGGRRAGGGPQALIDTARTVVVVDLDWTVSIIHFHFHFFHLHMRGRGGAAPASMQAAAAAASASVCRPRAPCRTGAGAEHHAARRAHSSPSSSCILMQLAYVACKCMHKYTTTTALPSIPHHLLPRQESIC